MRRTAFIPAAAGVLALVVACADEMPRDVQEATTPPAAQDALAADARPADTLVDEFAREPDQLPPGGYVDWIEDIRLEVPRLLNETAADRGAALDALRQLYLVRFEPLRTHFGAGGMIVASDAMAAAVSRADEQFQGLMRQLAAADVPAERIREVAVDLIESLNVVQAQGEAAGLSPDAPRG